MDIHHFPSMGSIHHTFERPGSDIKKSGYLRKLKTMKKKFFVLRSTSSSGHARLEYYSSEKKFQAGNLPKRSIQLHTCFNINRRPDIRGGRWGIVLYTVQDSFAVLAETEEEQESWLALMLKYQNEYVPDGNIRKEHYEHVWPVTMLPRGLGQGKGNKGLYRMCLNSSTVNLFKVNSTEPQFIIQLVTVRAVAHHENSFWLTVGNYASTGPGEFYFTVDGSDTAKDIHTTILNCMSSVHDVLKKNQPFGHSCSRETSSSLHDGFGGSLQQHMDPLKFYAGRSRQPDDGVLGFMKDSLNHWDVQRDLTPPLCPSDLDKKVSPYIEFPKPDFASMMLHQGPHSSHPASMHAHNFSDLQFLTHLPTVREGGSGEGYLLSDIPSSCSSELPRPEPATCLLSDDSDHLPPRTYSLGSKPVKKFQGYSDTSKQTDNEMSRATSAPHILKGRREHERPGEFPTPAVSQLSMSLKSDDSDSFADFIPIRPRTASDSFNYRPRTSSFGKLQQNCRPRSSSYGQGKRPVINMNKLRLEKAMMSQDMQRTSRESSILGSFESLRVSRESLRRTSQELKQPGGSNADDADIRSTPSPQMKNTSDLDEYVEYEGGKRKTDSVGSGRSNFIMTRDHQRHQPRPQQINEYVNMAPSCVGSDSGGGQQYVNVDYGTRPGDIKPVSVASQIQPSSRQDSAARYRNVDPGTGNKRSAASRSVSMENVDTYFISDFHLGGGKPRTGSCGSKDKHILRPESTRKSPTASVSSSSAVSSSAAAHPWPHSTASVPGATYQQQSSSLVSSLGAAHQPPHPLGSSSAATHPWPHSTASDPGVTYQQQPPLVSSLGAAHQPHPLVSSSGISHKQPSYSLASSSGISHQQPPHSLASSSTRTFGSSDSIRKTSSAEKNVVLGKDFRKKSGSTGSRPTSTLGKEQIAPGTMPSRKLSSTRFSEEEPTYGLVKFAPTNARSECYGHSSFLPSGLPYSSHPMTYSGRGEPYPSGEAVTPANSKSIPSTAGKDGYVFCNLAATSSAVSPHVPNNQQNKHGHSHQLPPHLAKPATSSSQTKHVSTKDELDYVPFDLGKASHSVPPHGVRNPRLAENKDEQMRFIHIVLPSSSSSTMSSSGHKPASSQDVEEYVNYQPINALFPTTESLAPSSAASHIHSPRPNEAVAKPKLKHQHLSLETTTSVNKFHKPAMGSLLASQTFTSDSANQSENTCLVAQHLLPPVPPLPTLSVTPRRTPSSSKETSRDDCGYFQFGPDAASAAKGSSQGGASLDLLESDNMAATCPSQRPCHDSNSASTGSDDVQNGQTRQQQQQSQSFQRQLSAPVYSSVLGEPHQHAPSARTLSTDKTCTPCSLPDSDNKSSPGSCTKHLQLTRTSNSSQKSSIRSSPDPEMTTFRGNNSCSDMFACSGDVTNKCKVSGLDNSALTTPERHVFPSNQSIRTFSCGETSLSSVKSSESNIIPNKARTRHSLGDIMSVIGIDRWKRQGNRASSDMVTSTNPSYRDSLALSLGPRSRHSLSDLGSCQHMLPSELASPDSKSSTALDSCKVCNTGDLSGSRNRGHFSKPSNRS